MVELAQGKGTTSLCDLIYPHLTHSLLPGHPPPSVQFLGFVLYSPCTNVSSVVSLTVTSSWVGTEFVESLQILTGRDGILFLGK